VTSLRDNGIVRWMERSVLLLLCCYFAAHTLPRAWNKLNTDFPNYYLAARLAHEGFDTSRMYEWIWLQREKDHRALDVPVIGLMPITPFSTLPMLPLARLSPLGAKRVWIVFNLVLLVPLCWLLRSLTGLPYRRIALIFALSFPLHRDLLYGQYYVLLLLLIVAACWAFLREWPGLAGVLIGLAAACKIFPAIFFVFFLQRRSWRALIAGAATVAGAVALSIGVFGWSVHRTYLDEILPWTLHGEGLPPYDTASASISSVLHFLFLDEPQWNAHPWHASPLWYALLQATLPLLLLAPAILLLRRGSRSARRVLLEWSALLAASLAVSTIPASYNFVLLVFPVCVLTAILLERRRFGWLAALAVAFIGIGLPLPGPHGVQGPDVLLHLPRLPLLVAVLLGVYVLLWSERLPAGLSPPDWLRYAWVLVLVAAAAWSVPSTLRREKAVREEYRYRVPLATQALLAASPERLGDELENIAFTSNGYRLETPGRASRMSDMVSGDELSFSQGASKVLIETTHSGRSDIVPQQDSSRVLIANGRQPMLSADEGSLAYVRDDRGRGTLMSRTSVKGPAQPDVVLTPTLLNVYEASFISARKYAFSATENGGAPGIYLTDGEHQNAPLRLGEARYPALSTDGHWLAYSRFDGGAWNLWLRNEQTGATRRLAQLPCNQIEPSWESDAKTLVYATDCGRSLWLTAIARRRVLR
jgi:Glycosyltransferase family 87